MKTKERRQETHNQLMENKAFRRMETLQRWLDEYYLDGLIGLIPFGIGDFLSACFAAYYVWFSYKHINSIPLTLAILNNTLRDVMLGLLPFYIGNIIDFFHRSNRDNMQMIRRFLEGDATTIRKVNLRATQSIIGIVLFLLLIILLMALIIYLPFMILDLFK